MKNPKTLLHVCVIGTALVAMCWVFFIGLTFYELWRKKQFHACSDDTGLPRYFYQYKEPSNE